MTQPSHNPLPPLAHPLSPHPTRPPPAPTRGCTTPGPNASTTPHSPSACTHLRLHDTRPSLILDNPLILYTPLALLPAPTRGCRPPGPHAILYPSSPHPTRPPPCTHLGRHRRVVWWEVKVKDEAAGAVGCVLGPRDQSPPKCDLWRGVGARSRGGGGECRALMTRKDSAVGKQVGR